MMQKGNIIATMDHQRYINQINSAFQLHNKVKFNKPTKHIIGLENKKAKNKNK